MITVQNIYKQYGDTSVLQDVSFEIGKGEVVGLLGQNGVGKTTLMRIIMGFLPATRGEVLIDSENVTNKTLEIRKKIGYLPEGNPLYLEMHVHEYLNFIAGVKQVKNKDAAIKDVVKKTFLEEKISEAIGNLSKGYKQRVGLAASLLGDPDILILDEPSSGLDPNQAIEMRKLIKKVGETKTVIFSSHIMQEVEAVCDRVIILHDKKIQQDSSIDEVGKGAGLIELEVKISGDDEKIYAALSELEVVEKLLRVEKNIYKVASSSAKINKKVFALCAQNNWAIEEMKEVESSLEEVFKNLTVGK